MENQMEGCHTNYQWKGWYQGLSKDRENAWKDWRCGNWSNINSKKDRYIPTNDLHWLKDLDGQEGSRTEESLTKIFNKVEWSNKIMNDLKNDLSTLCQTMASHSISIKLLETQLFHISTHLNARQNKMFPSDMIPISKNECWGIEMYVMWQH